MPVESDLVPAAEAGAAQCLQLVIPADALAVRDALVGMFDTLILRSLTEDQRGTVEIVLAEALNNIVEHAYAAEAGEIEITLRRAPEGLICQIVDQGLPMPDGVLPSGRLPARSEAELPEGGFGWYLIRTLSEDLDYRRDQGRNCLTFRLGPAPPYGQSH